MQRNDDMKMRLYSQNILSTTSIPNQKLCVRRLQPERLSSHDWKDPTFTFLTIGSGTFLHEAAISQC